MALDPSSYIFKDQNLKSMLDIVLESSMKNLTQLRDKLKDSPEEPTKKERIFIANECAKLECIGSLQVKLVNTEK